MINSFSGPYAFLSNFHPSPISVMGLVFPTVEHAYQAAKVDITGPVGSRVVPLEWVQRIACAETAARAKQIGRAAPLRDDWENRKFDIMEALLRQKFAKHPTLRIKLLATRNEILVEGNKWCDQTWGDCHCAKHADLPGINALGIILMRLRLDHLKEE